MKIRFTSSGGIAGGPRRCEKNVEDLTAEQVSALNRLREMADASTEDLIDPMGCDIGAYEIEIEDATGVTRLKIGELSVPEEIDPLISALAKDAEHFEPD